MEISNSVKSETQEHTSNQDSIREEVSVGQSTTFECKQEVKSFQCGICGLHERYDYFGNDPPFVKMYKLLENAYVIEDPFVPPKQSEFIILGSHCIKCGKTVCKDSNCSLYYDGTYCINCAKSCIQVFPQSIQEKLNKIIT